MLQACYKFLTQIGIMQHSVIVSNKQLKVNR